MLNFTYLLRDHAFDLLIDSSRDCLVAQELTRTYIRITGVEKVKLLLPQMP